MTTHINIPKEQIIEGATLMAFAVEPQPKNGEEIVLTNGEFWLLANNQHRQIRTIKPSFSPGDIIVPSTELGRDYTRYKGERCQPASTMPPHPAENTYRIIGVENVKRVQELTGGELGKMGFPIKACFPAMAQTAMACLDIFKEHWNKINSKHPWPNDPWIELYKVEVVE